MMTKKNKTKKQSVSEKILKLSDFLKIPRTAEEIKKEIKDKFGHVISITDIRVNLLYLLRRDRIQREKDKTGEYRYHT